MCKPAWRLGFTTPGQYGRRLPVPPTRRALPYPATRHRRAETAFLLSLALLLVGLAAYRIFFSPLPH